MHDAFLYVLAFVNLVSMIHLGFFIVGGNAYDGMQFRNAFINEKKRLHYGNRKRKHPLVSVVIPAHNESVVIKRTLDSVRASSYRNIEIIIIDDGSTDDTAKIVRNYIKNLPQFNIQSYLCRYSRGSRLKRRYIRADVRNQKIVLVTQSNSGKASAMNNAITNHVEGELVMCLDADSTLMPNAIEKAVGYFKDKSVIGVAANVRIIGDNSWLSILQRFEHLIGYRAKKFYTITGSEFIVGGVASTYRTNVLRRNKLYDTDTITEDIGLSMKLIANEGNREKRIIYAADVVAMTEGVQTFRALIRQRYRWKMGSLQNLYKYRSLFFNVDGKKFTRFLTLYRLPMAIFGEMMLLIEPLLLAYIVYISIAYQTIFIILGAYLTVTLYTFWAIWPDEHMTLKQKARMSVLSFIIYILFYAMNLVQTIAIVRCLWNKNNIVHRVTGRAIWTSPTRSGQQTATY